MNHGQENQTSQYEGEIPVNDSIERSHRERNQRRGVNLLNFLLPGKLRDISGLALIFVGVIAISAVILVLVALIAYVVQRSGESVNFVPTLVPTPTYELLPASATVTGPPLPTASPLLTATLTAPALGGPTSVPQVAPGLVVEVSGTGASGLRVRSGPGRSYVTTKVFDEGSRLEVLEGPEKADDIEWWRLKAADGIVGWAASDFLKPVDDLGGE